MREINTPELWDGFRAIAHRDGDDIVLMSKNGQPLGRYFPEIVAALAALPAEHFSLDGELVVPFAGVLSFDADVYKRQALRGLVLGRCVSLPLSLIHI